MTRRWLCYECGCTNAHSVTRWQDTPRLIVDGWQAQFVKLPSTRSRKCSGCGELKRAGYREVRAVLERTEGKP